MGIFAIVLLCIFGAGLLLWLSVGYIRWYNVNVGDVQWVRAIPELIYYGVLTFLVAGFILLLVLAMRRSKRRKTGSSGQQHPV